MRVITPALWQETWNACEREVNPIRRLAHTVTLVRQSEALFPQTHSNHVWSVFLLGESAIAAGRFSTATDYLIPCIGALEETDPKLPILSDLYAMSGKALSGQGRFEEATDAFSKSRDKLILLGEGLSPAAVGICCHLAFVSLRWGHMEEAVMFSNDALTLARVVDHRYAKTVCAELAAFGEATLKEGYCSFSRTFCGAALTLHEHTGTTGSEALHTAVVKARAENRLGMAEEALATINRIATLGEVGSSDTVSCMQVLLEMERARSIGICEQPRSQVSLLAGLRSRIDEGAYPGADRLFASVLFEIATAQCGVSDFEGVIKHATQGLTHAKSADNSLRGALHSLLGFATTMQGESEVAEEHYLAALEQRELAYSRGGGLQELLFAHLEMFYCCLDLKKPREAGRHLSAAQRLVESQGNGREGIRDVRIAAGYLSLRRKRWGDAIEQFGSAEMVEPSPLFPRPTLNQFNVHFGRGRAYFGLGLYQKSSESFFFGREVLVERGITHNYKMVTTLSWLALALQKAGDRAGSRDFYEQAKALRQELSLRSDAA